MNRPTSNSSAVVDNQFRPGTIPFSVDSALLRELGERLVGKPHIALAELVKNSYDADARKVIIRVRPDAIEIHDNGHGMNFDEFEHFWMRIGTPHKQAKRYSRNLGRPMTGSKGVGRLAVQFLADKIELRTVSEYDPDIELIARVDWNEAVQAGELTRAEAKYEQIVGETTFPDASPHGTILYLSGLKQNWSTDNLIDLAREIWWLQPPFKNSTSDSSTSFVVELDCQEEAAVRNFEKQMRAYLDLWYARIVGRLVKTSDGSTDSHIVRLSLQFVDESPITIEYPAPKCQLHQVDFEIRIFHLKHRQKHGIRVDEAREYLNQYGGVHVYDAGFHLPYYGPDTDWLGIEQDHAHRLSRSKLLPDKLQVPKGMQYLPTQSRILGVVHVDTPGEQKSTSAMRDDESDHLRIAVTRDRLVNSTAFQQLHDIVRWAIDFYAMQEAARAHERAEQKKEVEPLTAKFERVEEVLEYYANNIPQPVYQEIRNQVQDAIKASETEAEELVRQAGLLGTLATAGISALAFEHEFKKQFTILQNLVSRIEAIEVREPAAKDAISEITLQLSDWIEKARATRTLFSPFMNEQDRQQRARFKAKALIDQIRKQVEVLLRGIPISTEGIAQDVRLPEGTNAEWSALFQNIFINAVNALLDSNQRRMAVSSRIRGRAHAIIVQDTGCGVNLSKADELFKPFVRRLEISPERRQLGYGGSGLGLTIVRMIAENLHCKVAFVEPDKTFSTAFQLSWSEKK